MLRWSIVLFASGLLWAQSGSFPLEDVKISGSQVPATVVMEISGLKLGQSINEGGIQDACQKLGQSGIFEEVSYRYAPGPQKGYIVTLQLTDPKKLVDAALDIPSIDEKAAWGWITTQFPDFLHQVPQAEEAQQYLATTLEHKFAAGLHGEHLVVRLEQVFATHRSLVSFQPEHLPQIAEMKFNGASRISADELNQLMRKLVANDGYLDRHFRNVVEEALRQFYEQHGMFKVQFPAIQAAEFSPSSVSVTTTIIEGIQYQLADIQLIGDDLPADAMWKAAKFQKGKVANWSDIQQGILRLEVPVKRTGYTDAVAVPERVLDDNSQSLLLKVSFRKGSLYHFGDVTFRGLSPELDAKAHQIWKMKTGDPFDFRYAGDFFRNFSQLTDLRVFKNLRDQDEPGPGDHVKNVIVSFQPK
jgi:outer membrane protein assembly factor BamA